MRAYSVLPRNEPSRSSDLSPERHRGDHFDSAFACGQGSDDVLFMFVKIFAALSLGGVLIFGAAIVSKAKSPTPQARQAGATSLDPIPVATISVGEEVELYDHVTDTTEYTIFDFTADW